jgi:hypothetical protein
MCGKIIIIKTDGHTETYIKTDRYNLCFLNFHEIFHLSTMILASLNYY